MKTLAARATGAMMALCLAISNPCFAQSPQRKRIAILDFTNAAVQGGVSSPYLQTNTPELGKGVSELLISKLVQGGNVVVVERESVAKVIQEQNLTNSDRADPANAAQIGRLLGVDAIVLGTITRYDYDEKLKGYLRSGSGRRAAPPTQAKYDVKAKVQITTRLVSPDTSEILAVSEGTGESDRKSVVMDVRDTSGRVLQAVGLNNPAVNESMDKAITQLAAQIEPAIANLAPRPSTVEGLVADVSDSGEMVLNVGAQQGLKTGDHLQVLRPGKEIRDPATGKVLTRNETLLGEAVVTKVTEISSVAQYHGTEPAQVRDLVRTIPNQH